MVWLGLSLQVFQDLFHHIRSACLSVGSLCASVVCEMFPARQWCENANLELLIVLVSLTSHENPFCTIHLKLIR